MNTEHISLRPCYDVVGKQDPIISELLAVCESNASGYIEPIPSPDVFDPKYSDDLTEDERKMDEFIEGKKEEVKETYELVAKGVIQPIILSEREIQQEAKIFQDHYPNFDEFSEDDLTKETGEEELDDMFKFYDSDDDMENSEEEYCDYESDYSDTEQVEFKKSRKFAYL